MPCTKQHHTPLGQNGEMRVKHGEVVIPIVTGTIAQQLPKSKVRQQHIHKGVHNSPGPARGSHPSLGVLRALATGPRPVCPHQQGHHSAAL